MASMARYRISRRETLVHGDVILEGGSLLPSNIGWDQKRIDQEVARGFLVRVNDPTDNPLRDVGSDPESKAIPAETDDDLRELRTTDPVDAKGNRNKAAGAWSFNPKDLKALPLEVLNQRILEIDHTIEPFQTKEEAIAQLSQDFRGAR